MSSHHPSCLPQTGSGVRGVSFPFSLELGWVFLQSLKAELAPIIGIFWLQAEAGGMHCSSSDLLVNTTCPTELGCWHPMAFPAGTTASCQSLLPEMDFPVCPTPLPAPTHTAVIVPGSPGPTPTGAHYSKWLAPSFQNSLGFACLPISSNCKVGNAPLSPHG